MAWDFEMEKHGFRCLCNTPVSFETMILQSSTSTNLPTNALHNNHMIDMASVLESHTWCVANTFCMAPAQIINQHPLASRISLAIEPLQTSRSILKEHFYVSNVYDSIPNAITALKTSQEKFNINAYFATVIMPLASADSPKASTGHTDLKSHWTFINSLKQLCNLKMFIIHLSNEFSQFNAETFISLAKSNGWYTSFQSVNSLDHYDLVETTFSIILGVNEEHFPNIKVLTDSKAFDNQCMLHSSPAVPNGFESILHSDFNQDKYSIPIDNKLFTFKLSKGKQNSTNGPSVTGHVLPATFNIGDSTLGYEVYDTSRPAPLPSLPNQQYGIFGNLFGITFQDKTKDIHQDQVCYLSIFESV